ncbi:MAG: hypothetical protein ABIT01_09345 [Thermoanaerobaculia bacterium]
MSSIPAFFVPDADDETREAAYAAHAERCGRPVQPLAQRIFSIAFTSNNEEWIATVGQPLSGVFRRVTTIAGKRFEQVQKLDDPAVVLAIFAGDPFRVVTDAFRVRSSWDNPFSASPSAITYFSHE